MERAIQDEALIPDRAVCTRYGISLMTLYRWDRDSSLGFPKPIRIRTRKYRRVVELDEFDARRMAERDEGWR